MTDTFVEIAPTLTPTLTSANQSNKTQCRTNDVYLLPQNAVLENEDVVIQSLQISPLDKCGGEKTLFSREVSVPRSCRRLIH